MRLFCMSALPSETGRAERRPYAHRSIKRTRTPSDFKYYINDSITDILNIVHIEFNVIHVLLRAENV